MSDFMGKCLIINDETDNDLLFPKTHARGYVERDYSLYPESMFAPPSDMKVIPRSEWDARIQEQEDLGSSLEHIRMTGNNGAMIPSLNQGQVGYCWAHSTTHTVMLNRATSNQPYVPLSAYAVASIIKSGRDEGGWCGLSAQFARETGIPSQALWPQGNRSLSLDTPQMRANAALHKITEDWVDLTKQVYNQNLTFDQVATCLLLNIPCAIDESWWSHSICAIRLVRIEAGSYGIKIWNSWGDTWSDNGMGILQGTKAIPNGAIATRATGASAA